MKNTAQNIISNLIKLQGSYAQTFRSITTKERYNNVVKSGMLQNHSYDSNIIREPLIEHVGHLPIIASYLHQFTQHKDKINLGRVLIMLSIHDIGETKVGDVITYSKDTSHEKAELEAAKKLLPNNQFEYFKEFEDNKTFDAKFARSVDSIAPLLREINMPTVTLERFKYYNFNTDKIIAKKASHFKWDNNLQEMFEYIIDRFKKIEDL